MFTRKILLPSNGFKYSRIAEVTPFTYETIINISDPFYSSSESDLMINILGNHLKNIDIFELLYQDAYFLWNFLYNHAVNEQVLRSVNICGECWQANQIKTPVQSLEIKNLSLSAEKSIKHKIKVSNYGDIVVQRKRRTLYHNFLTSNDIMENWNDEFRDLTLMNLFIEKQIELFSTSNKTFLFKDSNEIKSFLSHLTISEIKNLFTLFREDDFGIQNDLFYKCTRCNAEQRVLLSDPYFSCFFNQQPSKEMYKKILGQILVQANSKLLRHDEILKVPYANSEEYFEVLAEKIKNANANPNETKFGSPFSGTLLEEVAQ